MIGPNRQTRVKANKTQAKIESKIKLKENKNYRKRNICCSVEHFKTIG